ncbi:RuvB-like protein [Acrasis kona]|uniref:RuvB-like protein n=1 Tax=Acrasis kona TaxID=1008807 RepID=A0AAW2YQ71_9EUKA
MFGRFRPNLDELKGTDIGEIFERADALSEKAYNSLTNITIQDRLHTLVEPCRDIGAILLLTEGFPLDIHSNITADQHKMLKNLVLSIDSDPEDEFGVHIVNYFYNLQDISDSELRGSSLVQHLELCHNHLEECDKLIPNTPFVKYQMILVEYKIDKDLKRYRDKLKNLISIYPKYADGLYQYCVALSQTKQPILLEKHVEHFMKTFPIQHYRSSAIYWAQAHKLGCDAVAVTKSNWEKHAKKYKKVEKIMSKALEADNYWIDAHIQEEQRTETIDLFKKLILAGYQLNDETSLPGVEPKLKINKSNGPSVLQRYQSYLVVIVMLICVYVLHIAMG